MKKPVPIWTLDPSKVGNLVSVAKQRSIKDACLKQYRETGAVLTPEHCHQCAGCALGSIIEAFVGGE